MYIKKENNEGKNDLKSACTTLAILMDRNIVHTTVFRFCAKAQDP